MEKKQEQKRPQPLARINTRLRREQHSFIKITAAKTDLTEGELFREIVDYYIDNNK